MPDEAPIRIPRYIQLTVKTPLETGQMRHWLAAARAGGPSGVLATIQATNDRGNRTSVCMVHQEGQTLHHYRIPLTRDLLAGEVKRIVTAFVAAEPALDFDIETNQSRIESIAPAAISADDAEQVARCAAQAKAEHAAWMAEKLADGWRFATSFSMRQKTHPLLRPWEQLPDRCRQPDLDAPLVPETADR